MKVGTSVLAFCYLSFVAFAKEDVGSIIGDQQVTDPVSVGDNSILNYYGGSNYFFSNNIQVGRGALYIGKESFFSSSQNAGKDDDGTFSFLVKYTNNLQNNGQFTIDSVKRDSDSCGNTNIELYPTNFQNDGTFEIITGGSEGTCCKPSTIVAPQNFLNNGNFFYKVTTGTGSILYNSCRQELVVGTSTKITVNNNLWQYSGSVNAQINGPVSGSAQINLDGSNMFVNTNTFSGQVVNLINGGSFIQTSDPLSNNVVINGLGTAAHTITTIAVKGMGKGFTYNPATGIVKLSTTDGRTYSYQIGCGYDPTKLSAKDVTGSFYDTSGQYFMLTYSEEYKPHTCDPGNTSIYSSEVHEETSSTISIHTSTISSSTTHTFSIPPPYTTTRSSGTSIIDTEIVSFYSTTDSPGHTITGTTTTTLYESSIYSSSSSTIQESELSNTSRTTMTSNSSVSISSTSSRSSFSNTKSSTIVISQSASLPDSKTDIILSTSSNIGYSSRSLLSDLGTSISDSDIHHSVLHSTESYSSNESGTNPFTSIASLSNFIPESSSHTSTALGSENSVISSDILTTMSHPVATNSGDKPTTPKRSEQVSTTMTSSGPTPDTSSFDTDGMSAYSRPEFTTNSLEVNKSSTSQLGNNKQTFSNLQLESTRPHSENEVDNNTRLLQSIQQSSTYGTNNVNPLSPTGSISIPLTEDGQGDNNNWNSPATNDLCTQISFNLTATTITVTDRITITDSIHDISSEVITSYIYQTIVDQKTVTQTVDGKSLANKMSSIPKPSSRSLIQPHPPVAIELQEGAASTSRVSLVSLFISIILVLL